MRTVLLYIGIWLYCNISWAQENTRIYSIPNPDLSFLLQQTKWENQYCVLVHRKSGYAITKPINRTSFQIGKYLGKGWYYASINAQAFSDLYTYGIDSLRYLNSGEKLQYPLNDSLALRRFVKPSGKFYISFNWFPGISISQINLILFKLGISGIYNKWCFQTVQVEVNYNQMISLSNIPALAYFSLSYENYLPLDRPQAGQTRTFSLNSSGLPMNKYSGKNIYIGMGDGGFVSAHKDHQLRIMNSDLSILSGYGDHQDHVAGIICGNGNLIPVCAGIAPQAIVITAKTTNILDAATDYLNMYKMQITSNTYAYSWVDCSAAGAYTIYSSAIDEQLRLNPSLLHVFACGNDGANTCSPYPAGFGTLANDLNVAKNVLTVGNTDALDNLNAASGRGPAADGRLKPDLVVMGTAVYSTIPTNTYINKTGTSMAAPLVAGICGLLSEQYRNQHSDSLPAGELLKSLLMLTADDLGNNGPDFKYGFGRVNTIRATEVISNNQYIYNSIDEGDSQIYSINIPAGTSQFRVMLGWRDFEGSASGISLVNNLDLKLYANGILYKPWVLDTTKSNVNSNAVRGTDNLNNHELITWDNPSTGSVSLVVNGSEIPQGPQPYYLIYEFRKPHLSLTYPVPGQKLIAGYSEFIRWDALGFSGGTYTLSISSDSGSSWSVISSAVSGNSRNFAWTVPNEFSDHCLLRIIHSGGIYSDTITGFFTITPQPVSVSSSVCDKQIHVKWNQVSSATGYDVWLLDSSDNWSKIKSVTDTTCVINGLKNGVSYAIAVSVMNGTINGDRSSAILATPSATNCGYSGELSMLELIAPVSGRKGTLSELSSSSVIKMSFKNSGSGTLSNIPVGYIINNGTPVIETVNGNLSSGNTKIYTFSTTANLSTIGKYTIKIFTGLASDPEKRNDTLIYYIYQYNNNLFTLPYIQNFNTIKGNVYNNNNIGLGILEEWDYTNNSSGARLRAGSGLLMNNEGITLDKASNGSGTVRNFVTLNLNLAAYDTSHKIKFQYDIISHGDEQGSYDSVWVRGADTKPWIKIHSWINGAYQGMNRTIDPVKLDSILQANNQNFTSSFQIRWGQSDDSSARVGNMADGCTLNNIYIYEDGTDLEIVSINFPTQEILADSDVQITVKIKNKGNTDASQLYINYKVDSGQWQTGLVNLLNAGQIFDFSFSQKANLSKPGLHTIHTEVIYAQDIDTSNNQLSSVIRSLPLVSQFPYLESFEKNNNYWFTDNSSCWQWGTPQKNSIQKSASGTKCWTTHINSDYYPSEQANLYSPVFDFRSLQSNPALAFHLIYKSQNGPDSMFVEYSEDGYYWKKLGTYNSGLNWYNSSNQVWTGCDTPWHAVSSEIPLQNISDSSQIRFRFRFFSDYLNQDEGFAIDNIHIYERNFTPVSGSVYDSMQVSGNSWVTLLNGNKRVVSIQPQGNQLGEVKIGSYLHTGVIRSFNGQKYMNRSWSIVPVNQPTSPVLVRFYFYYNELMDYINSDSLVQSFSDVGITQYSGTNTDSSIYNNSNVNYQFITPGFIEFVPIDSGYYVEFSVTGFSEFYLNSGGIYKNNPLPLSKIFLSGKVVNRDADLKWYSNNVSNKDSLYIFRKKNNGELEKIYKLPSEISHNILYNYYDENIFNNSDKVYYVIGDSLNGNWVEVSNWLILEGDYKHNDVSVYPNPCHKFFNITIPDFTNFINPNIEIYNSLGVKIRTGISAISDGDITLIHLNDVPAGNYWIVITAEGHFIRKLILVK